MLLGIDVDLQTNLVCRNQTLKNSKQENLLGITIDNKLNIDKHLSIFLKLITLNIMHKQELENTWLQIKKMYILFLY